MNKYLMMSAAAVLASTAGANASGTPHSFVFATAGGSSYCDGGTVYTGVDGGAFSGTVRAWQHTNNNCSGGVSTGQGLLGKALAIGKASDMSDNYFGNYKSIALNYTLPKKIKNGQPWTLWVEFSGTTSFEGNSGVLVNTNPGHKGAKSTVANLKTLITAHRNAHKG